MIMEFISKDQTSEVRYYINSESIFDVELRKNSEGRASVFNLTTTNKTRYISTDLYAEENLKTFWQFLNNVIPD